MHLVLLLDDHPFNRFYAHVHSLRVHIIALIFYGEMCSCCFLVNKSVMYIFFKWNDNIFLITKLSNSKQEQIVKQCSVFRSCMLIKITSSEPGEMHKPAQIIKKPCQLEKYCSHMKNNFFFPVKLLERASPGLTEAMMSMKAMPSTWEDFLWLVTSLLQFHLGYISQWENVDGLSLLASVSESVKLSGEGLSLPGFQMISQWVKIILKCVSIIINLNC